MHKRGVATSMITANKPYYHNHIYYVYINSNTYTIPYIKLSTFLTSKVNEIRAWAKCATMERGAYRILTERAPPARVPRSATS